MNKKKNSEFPFSALKDLTAWLESKKIKGIIIGGIAASIIGRPRVTHDIDSLIIIQPEFTEEFIKSGIKYGFIPRIKDVNRAS